LEFDLEQNRQLAEQLGAVAVRHYQRHGADADGFALPKEIVEFACINDFVDDPEPPASWSSIVRGTDPERFRPLVVSRSGEYRFATSEWFYFFCAFGLVDAVTNSRPEAVERHPYVNNTHQYLAALALRDPPTRDRMITVLIEWLQGRTRAGNGRPVVRN